MNVRQYFTRAVIGLCFLARAGLGAEVTISFGPAGAGNAQISGVAGTANICVDPKSAEVVHLAADLLADDFNRVTGHRPAVITDPAKATDTAILVGTLGDGGAVDQLAKAGKIDCTAINGKWECYSWQVIDQAMPRVGRALVIVGSDRRGTAYGLTDLSEAIGVSPWYWFADVPVARHEQIRATVGLKVSGPPGVKYRGIFLNDEDFGLRPWASKTFDPETGNFGPKTYEKIFELMLRLHLNCIWPAMHPGSAEFSTFPGNAELADRWAIVPGSSHCEPMLRNNVYWPKTNGEWRYDQNRDRILDYWKEAAVSHASFESLWTLGIRGIHDSPMSGPKDLKARVKMVEQTITDQRQLIEQNVTHRYGAPAQCFIPYKEVLPLYDAGMTVPDDVTLIWPDDNFGYVRRLATPAERQRPGGSGVYYHVSYWGSPHSYLWIETIPPGLMWEELHKAYENDSRAIWMLNVGDLKPAELAIDFYARLAWKPDQWGPDAQTVFLKQFFARTFGDAAVDKLMALQSAYYRAATYRKPEHMAYGFADSISAHQADELTAQYNSVLQLETDAAGSIRGDSRDAYFEMIGYPARMLAATGLLYLGPTDVIPQWQQYIQDQTRTYNLRTAGGKWRGMMSIESHDMKWPGPEDIHNDPARRPVDAAGVTIDAAASAAAAPAKSGAAWKSVAGLGCSGSAITVLPAVPATAVDPADVASAASMVYRFDLKAQENQPIKFHALPTLRLLPGMHLRIGVGMDGSAPQVIDIPGGEANDENSKSRRNGVITNRTTAEYALGNLAAGPHEMKLYAIDPGVVIDQIELPPGATVKP